MSKRGGARFVTNDWRQLSASTNEGFFIGGPSSNEMINFSDNGNAAMAATGGTIASQPKSVQNPGSNAGSNVPIMAQDIAWLKQDNAQIKNAIIELQRDRDNLRTAVRKLKVENARIKAKVKRLGEAVKHRGDNSMEIDDLEHDVDYDEIGQFLLIGGPKDPLALPFHEAPIQDASGVEHKTGERYLWYKMAETFDDKDAMQKILSLDDGRKAEEVMKAIANFNQAKWDEVKLKFWEEAQRLKFNQHRWIKCVLLKTGSLYLAVASQDKMYGTGWRKNRQEAGRTQLWDGENLGGKILMKLRDEYASSHTWATPSEEQDALKIYNEHRRSTWKPQLRRNGDARGFRGDVPSFPPMMKTGYRGRGRGGGSGAGVKKRREF